MKIQKLSTACLAIAGVLLLFSPVVRKRWVFLEELGSATPITSLSISISITTGFLYTLAQDRTKTLNRQLRSHFVILIVCASILQLLMDLRSSFASSFGNEYLHPATSIFLMAFATRGFLSKNKITADVFGLSLLCFFLENGHNLWFGTRSQRSSQDSLSKGFLEILVGLLGAVALSSLDTTWNAEPSDKLSAKGPTAESHWDDLDQAGPTEQSCKFRRLIAIIGLSQIVLAACLALALEGSKSFNFGLPSLVVESLLQSSPLIVATGSIICLANGDAVTAATITSLILVFRMFLDRELSIVSSVGLLLACLLAYRRLKPTGIYRSLCFATLVISVVTAQLSARWHMGLPATLRGKISGSHPLAILIDQSETTIRAFVAHEESIKTLSDASHDYAERYGRLPPPGFAEWFASAQSQDTFVISNYDQIDKDLAPFWAIEPAELRRRTYTAIQNRYNYISPLRIRNGTVTAPPMEIPTHYWMLERLTEMMQDFVHFLPDMDITINLNDEPRVMAQRHNPIRQHTSFQFDSFSLRPDSWLDPIPFTDETPASFEKIERMYKNTFDHSTRFCPDTSPAKDKEADHQPLQTLSAALIPTWQDTLDICDQRGLKNNRGFFVSPTTFDATDELLPVFSQSKPSTFSDILLPSPWNFGDKVGPDTVDPYNWTEKWDRVYWRGSTTEGWATMGSWRQMLRQTFVDLLGGADERSGAISYQEVEIFEGRDDLGYNVQKKQLADLHRFFDPDVFFVQVTRADEHDATDQTRHFRLQPQSEFRNHWRHRYLLDADGAAFSGRFLPFLNSNSLPLKFTSVFTEWWSDRVFAYQHFVPVTTESIFGILAYFIGFQDEHGKQLAQAHQDAADHIAQAGKSWLNKVVRKEDMKLYLWRLLLEYGRVVDDARDHIGYKHTSG